MKRLYSACILVFFAILAFHCQKEVNVPRGSDPNIPNTTTPVPITATLQGNVFDKNGDPAMDVTIKVGSQTATTNARGYFRIVDAPLDRNASVVTAEKAGYFKAYRTFSATSGVNQVTIKLIEKTVAGTIDAGTGGNVTLSNGSKIELPANGVVRASGGNYSGAINVYAAYIDPTASDINQVVPGSFIANDKNNTRVTLASYGMLAVELESPSGEKLQIAAGSKATLTTPIPAAVQSTAPATISLWYVDEQTGIWKEEGTATKSGTNYIGEVSHFSYWNCDIGVPTVGFTATVVGPGGPLIYTYVRVRPASGGYAGYAHGRTDSLGQLSGLLPANMNLVLEVMDECGNAVYTQNIGPFSSSVNLGTITVTGSSSAHIVTIEGKLLNCSNTAVTDGYAVILYDNYTRYAQVNNNGEFSVTFVSCNSSSAFCEVFGIDEGAQQQSATMTVPVTMPVTDAGDISACGTSTTQFINYNLDGTDYSITNSADSLIAYVTQGGTTTHPVQLMITGHSASDHISIKTNTTGAPGTFDIEMLNVQNYNSTTVGAATSTVTFTMFATAVGQFYEGSFFSNFIETSSTNPHTVSGTFRIRKSW